MCSPGAEFVIIFNEEKWTWHIKKSFDKEGRGLRILKKNQWYCQLWLYKFIRSFKFMLLWHFKNRFRYNLILGMSRRRNLQFNYNAQFAAGQKSFRWLDSLDHLTAGTFPLVALRVSMGLINAHRPGVFHHKQFFKKVSKWSFVVQNNHFTK